MSLEQVINYDTPGNFTYDSDKIEVTSNAALKEAFATNETFFASYASDINATRSAGSSAGTAVGGASVSGGYLVLDQSDVRHVDYNAASNADSVQVGCIDFIVKPDYTGSPAGGRVFFCLLKAAGDFSNEIICYHDFAGRILARIKDSAGTNIFQTNFGSWSPVAGTDYRFQLNWDITAGATRIFIDGTQFGSTETSTGSRDSSIALLRIGGDGSDPAADSSDFSIGHFQVFSTVQNTSDYTPEPPFQTRYHTGGHGIIVNSGVVADDLTEFEETTASAPSGSSIGWVVNDDGQDRYWTGSAWADSSGSPETNTAAEISSNLASFDAGTGSTIKMKAYLVSDDGSVTPTLTTATLDYDFAFNPTVPNECVVYGTVKDSTGDAIEGATVTVEPSPVFLHGENLIGNKIQASTDSAGRWDASIVETATVSATMKITIEWVDIDGKAKKKVYSNATIPNQATESIDNIV